MAYLSQELASASPAKRVLMLYTRAIGALHDAIRAIEAGDIQRRWSANSQAVKVIEALWITLDMDRGGEIAANLDRLYGFMLNHLLAVDIHNDPKPAKDVIALLEPLRQSWQELADREGDTAAATSPDSAPSASGTPDSADAPPTRIIVSA
ncbi:flagellar export chaperone FliS [Rhodospirillaceae bacterium SYSU D60014]|uniref:flagellar export chaperone FliS n=1 Tax=Virgifigura deserti TaxID=2268457 RepID=UPI0013C4DDCC